MIENGKESLSAAAARGAQTISAVRKHLVFVGGTSEPGGLHPVLCCPRLSRDHSVYERQLLCSFDRRGSVAIEVIRPLEKMAWREWVRTWRRLSAHGRPDMVFLCGKQGEIRIIDLAAAWLFGGTVYAVVHRPDPGDWTFRRALKRVQRE